MTKRILKALKKEDVDRPPFWFMRQAGRYLPEYQEIRKKQNNFLDFCFNSEKAAEVSMQPIRRYKMDAAIVFSDILVVPHALGQSVKFIKGTGPVLEPVNEENILSSLSLENINNKFDPVYNTLSRIQNELDDNTALIGFAGAPWTVALYMVEGKGGTNADKLRALTIHNPSALQDLIELLCEATTNYIIGQIKAGAEIIQIFDSWAGLLANEGDEDLFLDLIINPTKKIIEEVKAYYPDIPIIGFPKNANLMYKTFAERTKVDGLSIDDEVPLDWIAKEIQPICTVQGNLNNQLAVTGGEEMEFAVKKILGTLGKKPFIFNLGHGILPTTPPENIERISNLIKN